MVPPYRTSDENRKQDVSREEAGPTLLEPDRRQAFPDLRNSASIRAGSVPRASNQVFISAQDSTSLKAPRFVKSLQNAGKNGFRFCRWTGVYVKRRLSRIFACSNEIERLMIHCLLPLLVVAHVLDTRHACLTPIEAYRRRCRR
jgi:hypothetical protein